MTPAQRAALQRIVAEGGRPQTLYDLDHAEKKFRELRRDLATVAAALLEMEERDGQAE